MSPEQAAGRLDGLGPASDVYSLGATLYVMLTDRAPFSGDGEQILEDVRHGRLAPPAPSNRRCPGRWKRSACGQWRSSRQVATVRQPRWPRISNAGWPTTRSWRGMIPGPIASRRWVRRHQPFVAGCAAAMGVALLALGMAVPLLSLAWGNESAARRNEQNLRILAMRKAEEAKELQEVALRHSEIARRERAGAIASEKRANEEKTRAETALQFLVSVYRKPDPAVRRPFAQSRRHA